MMWPFKRCAHEWRVLDKTVIHGVHHDPTEPVKLSPENMRFWLRTLTDRVALTVACDKCGKLRTLEAA